MGTVPGYLLRKGAFFVKYYSKAFSTLPGLAGGLAQELVPLDCHGHKPAGISRNLRTKRNHQMNMLCGMSL